ncbi:MAG TPA: amidohydrolase/deacetylase family metallohydrolase [Candidatus Acidoferrales bacterium]
MAGGATLLGVEDVRPAGEQPLVTPQDSSIRNCDLVIKGGTVIDPGQHLHAEMDVAVKDGKIFEVSSNFPEARARTVISAKDKIVTPGLVDLHVHCFDGFGGVNADHYCLGRGSTTVVDCGSAGYPMIGGFVKYIVNAASTRIFALVDIGEMGTVFGTKDSMKNLDWVNPTLTANAADANKPAVVGIKVRLQQSIQGTNDLECLKRALTAAQESRLPLMAHVSDPFSPLPDILKMMRKGDVVTHMYNGHPHGILDSNGKVLTEVLDARERGVIFDSAHGRSHFSFGVAEKALQQNFLPDTISTDLSEGNISGPVFDLPTTISKFLAIGMDLDKAIDRVTARPAGVFDYGVPVGTLRQGSEADVSVFELKEGKFEFIDSDQQKRVGRQKLVNTAAICRGELFINEA